MWLSIYSVTCSIPNRTLKINVWPWRAHSWFFIWNLLVFNYLQYLKSTLVNHASLLMKNMTKRLTPDLNVFKTFNNYILPYTFFSLEHELKNKYWYYIEEACAELGIAISDLGTCIAYTALPPYKPIHTSIFMSIFSENRYVWESTCPFDE